MKFFLRFMHLWLRVVCYNGTPEISEETED